MLLRSFRIVFWLISVYNFNSVVHQTAAAMPADARVATARKIPVPNNYRYAAKLLRLVTEEKKSVKTLLRDEKHFRAGRTIMDRLLVNLPQINAIIAHIDLTTKEPRLNPWMARALISELLYGRGELLGASLPVECVRRYEVEIRKAYEATKASIPAVKKFEGKENIHIFC